MYTATATIPAGTCVDGDSVTYGGEVTDLAATPLTTVLGAGGPIVMADPPPIPAPYTVFGTVALYDGAGGVYAPILAAAPVTVIASWYDSVLGAINTKSYTTEAGTTSFYSIDIDNWVDGHVYGIEIEATYAGIATNLGHAWTILDDTDNVGSVQTDVVCGVPYEVDITTFPANTNAGIESKLSISRETISSNQPP